MLEFDRGRLGGGKALVGVDEVGRGPLAGPVVAAAVLLRHNFYKSAEAEEISRGVTDSKKLTAEARWAVLERFARIRERGWMRLGMGEATVEEIEVYNIAGATRLAMLRALEGLWGGGGSLWGGSSARILVDGLPLKEFPYEHEALVGGDGRSLAVALASIHAKEHRDAEMVRRDRQFPGYGWARNKGYGTVEHREALRRLGATPHHRRKFLKKILGG